MSDCDCFFPLPLPLHPPPPPSDLNSLPADFEDFLSPLPEPSASGRAQLQHLSCGQHVNFRSVLCLLCHL